jgi:adenosylhomocysteine nucleosidase
MSVKGQDGISVVVVISSDGEWDVVRPWLVGHYPEAKDLSIPYGGGLEVTLAFGGGRRPVRFIHGGWGKIAAAASAQYAVDRWAPDLLVNLGTCGGFRGAIERGDVVLVTRTLVYDMIEQMGDQAATEAHYTTDLDYAWLREPLPMDVRRSPLVSGDRDLVPDEVPELRARFGAVAGDWESASIAYVARRNGVRCLIIRGVTDLVGPDGGEIYDGTATLFRERAREVMTRLVAALPAWLDRVSW